MEALSKGESGVVLRLQANDKAAPSPGTGPLIGRQQDLHTLEHLLQAEPRLLVLSGPSGVGKSRLLLELANRMQQRFGSCHHLDFHRDADRLATVLEALATHARSTCLLIFDHVPVTQQAALEALLAQHRSWRMVAASDSPWASEGVQAVPVTALETLDDPSLAYPDAASRLFLQHAQRHDPHFQLNASNAQEIAALCRKLDGLPRAIIVAASQVGVLSPREMLEQPAALLRCPIPNNPHSNLEETIGKTLASLAPLEHQTLQALSLCHNPIGFVALQQLLGVDATQLALALNGLHGRHLLRRSEEHGDMRLQPLETVRLYFACLDPDENLEQAHARYFSDRAETTLQPSVYLPEQQRALEQLRQERPDLEQARMHWLRRATTDAQAMMRFTDLSRIIARQLSNQPGTQREALEITQHALTLEPMLTWQRALLLQDAATIKLRNEQITQAQTLLEQAHSLAAEIDDLLLTVSVAHDLAFIYSLQRRHDDVEQLLQDTLARQTHTQNSVQYGVTLTMLGWKRLDEHQFDECIQLMQQARSIFEQHDRHFETARALCGLACAHLRNGQTQVALGFIREACKVQHESNGQDEGDLWEVFGRCELEMGHWQAAWEHLELALYDCLARHNHNRVFLTLTGLCEVLLQSGQRQLAAMLYGHLEFVRCRFVPNPTGHGLTHLLSLQNQLRHLEPSEHQAWQHGVASTDTRALLELIKSRLGGALEPNQAAVEATDNHQGLSKRQLEVMQLIREGYSNKRIAQHLQLSESTVKFHITEIFNRLGVRTRIQALRAFSRT